MKKDPNKYPKGLTAAKVKKIIEYYDSVQDEDLALEIATAPILEPTVWVEVPAALLPKVKKLIAVRRKSA
jgi:hypothetical protein